MRLELSCLSEASSFRLGKCDDFLALERQPAVFLFVIFFFLMAERKSKCLLNRRILEKEKPLRLEQKNFNYQNLSFTYLFFLMAERKSKPLQLELSKIT